MTQKAAYYEAQTSVTTKPRTSTRLFFIDQIRIFLVFLVVLHHVALVYGAGAPFYYVEPPFTEPQTFQLLLIFVLVNQSWFMGAFFLLSGYFTPASFDRKGSRQFLKDRLLRLGIPLIVFTFILNPISELGVYLMPSALTGITDSPQLADYPERIGFGPLWFVAMLLIFCFMYAGWRRLSTSQSLSEGQSSYPTPLSIALFILILAGVSFVLRMFIPIGESISEFPTLAYLPQYLSFFLLGTIAYRRNWFRNLPDRIGFAGFVIATVSAIVLFPLAFSGEMLSVEVTPQLENAMGNGHWQSGVYALWDSAFSVGMCIGLIALTRRVFNWQNAFNRLLSRLGYTVYIIHIPIIVFIAYALRDVNSGSMLKFVLASIITLPVCFFVAYIIRKLPYASRIL